MRETHVSLAGCLCLSIVLGCATESTPLDATFNAPTGLVVAGAEDKPKLFIANAGEGKIRVLDVEGKDGLRDVQFEESELIYFPLEVRAGGESGYPTTLVRSGDGAYVLALDEGQGRLHLIDAVKLTSPESYRFSDLDPTAEPDARFSAVVARACKAPCEGEFVVALGGSSQVATLRLAGAPGAKSLEVVQIYPVGGEVLGMALAPDGNTLYLSTVSRGPEGGAGQHGLKSLSLDKGIVTMPEVELSWSPGTLAVSASGTALLVTRPEQQDVVLFSIKGGTLVTEPVDTNGRIGPELSCLGACVPGEEEVECGGHASVAGLCFSEQGLEQREGEYRGIYLPGIPSRLLTLGKAGGQPALRVPCEDNSAASFERVYSDYALVATLDGVIRYIGLQLEGGEEDFTPELVSFGWCRDGHLKPALPSVADESEVAEALTLNSLALAPCPEVPGRKRFECLELEADDAPDAEPAPHGAVAFGGLTYSREVRLDWEGSVSPSLARSRGGEVTDEGDFTDVFYSLGQHAEEIREGDILEITSEVELTSECREALGLTEDDTLTSGCRFERRVKEGPTVESPVLRLSEPLPSACFEAGGKVGYRIRMGDAFLVTVSPGGSYRVRPGERFGPGGKVGRGEPVLFDLAPGSISSDLSPCDRYDDVGRPVDSIPAVFRRTVSNELVAESVDHTFGFVITDRDYAGNLSTYNQGSGLTVETGLKLESEFSQTAISGTAGVLPGAMIVADSWGKDLEPVVVVSYTGRNSVLAMVPYTPDLSADRFEAGNYYLLE